MSFPIPPGLAPPASRMPSIPGPVIKKRAALLRQKGEEASYQFFQSCLGQDTSFLVESIETTKDGMIVRGKTDHFAPIHLETTQEHVIGSVMRAHIIEATPDGLKGKEIP